MESSAQQNAVAFALVGINSLVDSIDENAKVAEEPALKNLWSELFGV